MAKWGHTHYGHLLVLTNIILPTLSFQDSISYTLSSKSGEWPHPLGIALTSVGHPYFLWALLPPLL